MSHFTNGQVTLNDEPTKHRLYKFVQKKLSQWATENKVPDLDSATFHVAFIDEDDKLVSCETEVRVGERVVRSSDTASDGQQAFLHTLKRLHLN
jgi:hypothetical protein